MFSTVSFCTYVEFSVGKIFIGMQEEEKKINNDADWRKGITTNKTVRDLF